MQSQRNGRKREKKQRNLKEIMTRGGLLVLIYSFAFWLLVMGGGGGTASGRAMLLALFLFVSWLPNSDLVYGRKEQRCVDMYACPVDL